MKKLLYGTTALAAAGMIAGSASAAEQIKMGVGGYFQAYLVAGDQDDGVGQPGANLRGHKVAREGEIIFNGSTTLDNGLQFGVQVQLEAEVCGDQVDESFMWVSGSFGRINIGSENSAAYLMHYAAPAPSHWAHGLNSPNFSHAAAGANAAGRAPHTLPNITSDSEKITYFTPRLAGFQLGASYTPENCEEVTAGTACGGSYAGFGADNNANQQSEIIELGVNYVNKLGPVDLAISGSYGQGNVEAPTAGNSDREEWSLGFNVGFSGFTIGGAYRNDDLGLSTGNSEQHDYNLGVRYATGPWGVGLAWARITREAGPGLGEDETDAYELGGSYNLGPGIVLSGGIQYWDLEDNLNAAASENQATIFFVGTSLSF